MPLLTGQNALRFSQYTADQFSGNGVTTIFSLSRTPPTPASLIVTIDGIKQHSSTYTIGNNQIVFSEAPPNGSAIECTAIGNSGIAYEVTDGSITAPKIAADSVTNTKILDSAVTTSKIADGSLTTAKYDSLSSNGTGGIPLPSGTTAQRPVNPPNGTARYNTDFKCNEYYFNTFWLTADPTQQPAAPVGYHTWANAGSGSNADNSTGKKWDAFGERTANETWTVPAGVYYIFVKMWGAGGGGGAYGSWRQGSNGGGGGYTQAIVPVVPGEVITRRVAQRGYSRWSNNAAYPDGGKASASGGDNQYCGSGGGSTSILVPSVSSEYCLFAGGGGGGGSVNGYAFNSGGAGGGWFGQAGAYTAYNSNTNNGKGGTQTAGGAAGTGGSSTGGAGSFKQGGNHLSANNYGGGGGGGWYGGGSGAYGGSSMGGGGGGSGYVHPSLIGMTMTGSGNIPANHTDMWLGRFCDTIQYARGGEEDGYGGPGLLVWFY